MSFPGGTIAVVSGVLSRYPVFMKCLAALERPHGTTLVWSTGAGIAQNRNDALRHRQGAWVFFLDDDHAFEPDLLINLLKAKKDVVVPLVLRREPPHATVMYREYRGPQDVPPGEPWGFHTYFLKDDEPPALQRVYGAGTAGMLIQERVLSKLTDPWFEVGRFKPEELSEDLWFSKKVMEAGFEMWADTRLTMSHITPVGVWPIWREGKWYTGYQLATGAMPLVGPAKEEG